MDTGATSHVTSSQDNKVSLEFDPFGFYVNDFQTWMPIKRCEIQDDPYPIINHNITNKANDVWTSPILSSTCHKYYVLLLDNYSNFLWTFPISHNLKFIIFFKNCELTSKHNFNECRIIFRRSRLFD
ncbi:hypothetical protein MTR_5g060470 [Medicago truncatula]|uniref:Uncharacterized protein n=1 Tax=Medicago truncatula TaxID=3880 RepID=G7K9X0_MEDTR|nr:hypothetical protein MTR_5g060470 [Medicago truncatula]